MCVMTGGSEELLYKSLMLPPFTVTYLDPSISSLHGELVLKTYAHKIAKFLPCFLKLAENLLWLLFCRRLYQTIINILYMGLHLLSAV